MKIFEDRPEQFDLVITDQTMPKITGLKLANRMKTIRPDIPIILCSGLAVDIDETELRKAGIYANLQKPVSIEALIKIIRNLQQKNF